MPEALSIMKRRHWALLIIRAAALLMMIYGGIYIVWGLGTFFGLSLGGSTLLSGLAMTWGPDNFNPVWYGLAVLLAGFAVAASSRRLARWVVPVLRHECPQCGYALQQLSTSRCPECGFVFGAQGEREQSAPH